MPEQSDENVETLGSFSFGLFELRKLIELSEQVLHLLEQMSGNDVRDESNS